MSLDPVPSGAQGNLDEEISQLMQCKPLSEQEVSISISISSSFFLSSHFHLIFLVVFLVFVWMC